MLVYWKIKTSASSHINNFQKLIENGFGVGDEVFLNNIEDDYLAIMLGDKEILTIGKSALRQMLIGWEAMGLIALRKNKRIISCQISNKEDIIEYSKIFLLKNSKNKKVNFYRISKLINTLINSKIYTFSDLLSIGIKQQKGNITKNKVLEEISNYEKFLSKDNYFLKKAKEVIDAY